MEQRSLFSLGSVTVNGNVTVNNNVGRPTIDPAQDRSEQLKARYTPNEKERIRKFCQRNRISVTDFIRESSRLGYRYMAYSDVLDRDDVEDFLMRLFKHSDALRSKDVQDAVFSILKIAKKF